MGPRLRGNTTVAEIVGRGQQLIYFNSAIERCLPQAACSSNLDRLQSMRSIPMITALDSVIGAPHLPRQIKAPIKLDQADEVMAGQVKLSIKRRPTKRGTGSAPDGVGGLTAEEKDDDQLRPPSEERSPAPSDLDVLRSPVARTSQHAAAQLPVDAQRPPEGFDQSPRPQASKLTADRRHLFFVSWILQMLETFRQLEGSYSQVAATLEADVPGFHVRWQLGHIIRHGYEGESSLHAEADQPDWLPESLKGFWHVPKPRVMRLPPVDAQRMKIVRLSKEFFLFPIVDRIDENLAFASPFKTGRALLEKSWAQTYDNNPRYLIPKLKYWTAVHGRLAPRPPYRFRVLAAEVTPPNTQREGELISYWGGQSLATLLFLPAGLRVQAEQANRLIQTDFLSKDAVRRLNVITHDFCNPRIILTIVFLHLKYQSERQDAEETNT